MMSSKLIVLLCCAVSAVLSDMYTDKYDGMDVDEIIHNHQLMKGYVFCIMGKGKCTPAGKEIKENLIDSLETGCSKCTETQKKHSAKVIGHMIQNEVEFWEELCSKYDPDGSFRKKYEEEARQNGIIIPQPKK